MKFRIVKESCYGKAPYYYAQCRVLGLFWQHCWCNGFGSPISYSSRESALQAIERCKLGCAKTKELV